MSRLFVYTFCIVYTEQMKKTKRIGRPPKDNNATTTLPPIRVTPEQKDAYKAAADNAGLSLSAWLKMLADEHS